MSPFSFKANTSSRSIGVWPMPLAVCAFKLTRMISSELGKSSPRGQTPPLLQTGQPAPPADPPPRTKTSYLVASPSSQSCSSAFLFSSRKSSGNATTARLLGNCNPQKTIIEEPRGIGFQPPHPQPPQLHQLPIHQSHTRSANTSTRISGSRNQQLVHSRLQ